MRFVEAIARAVGSLKQFQEQETERIKRLACRLMTDEVAESYMLRAFEAGIVSHFLLPTVLKEWRKPSYGLSAPDRVVLVQRLHHGPRPPGPDKSTAARSPDHAARLAARPQGEANHETAA